MQGALVLAVAIGVPFPTFALAAAEQRVRVDPATGHFVDSSGRALLFHGVNVVQKSFPWYPSLGHFDPASSLNAEDMDNLRSWGFNAVRLGVMWPGVEPSPGEYNATYLRVVRQIVDDLHAKGIYTIVDFHQDLLSERWCGEGLPPWMTRMLEPLDTSCHDGIVPEIARLIGECKSFKDYNYSVDPSTGFPNVSQCLSVTFDHYVRTPEVASAWQHFYEKASVQEKFRGYWKSVASALAGAPGVLGYDLINEPIMGNFFRNISLVWPGQADRQFLEPMYAALDVAIRSVDSAAVLMYEPVPLDTFPSNIPVLEGVHPAGFTRGPADAAHQALSYHIYSCGFADVNCDRQGDPQSAACPVCDRFARDAVNTRKQDSERLGGAAFLTEFGACSGSERCIAEIQRVASLADTVWHSWAYWQFKYNHDVTTVSGPIEGFYNSDGSLQEAKVKALSRTYAPAVAGSPRSLRFDATTGAFRLQYDTQNRTEGLPTEIFLNENMSYPNGYTVSALNATTRSGGRNSLEVRAKAGLAVDVAVVRRPSRTVQRSMMGSIGLAATESEHGGVGVIHWQLAQEVGGAGTDQPADDDDNAGFELRTSPKNDTRLWKSLRIFNDVGTLECNLEEAWTGGDDLRRGPAPASCRLRGAARHAFLFDYRIEAWTWRPGANRDAWKKVATIPAGRIGPLLGHQLILTWNDRDDRTEEERRISRAVFV